MQFLRAIWFRLRAVFQQSAVNDEVNDELSFHVAQETAANVKRGMSSTDARQLALARFGGIERFREACADERDVRWLEDAVGDLKHAFRLLRKNVVFSAAVIVTLALGVGATSTIFAIVNAVLLRPLPYSAPDRIVSLTHAVKGVDRQVASTRDYYAFKRDARSLSAIAMYSTASGVMTGMEQPQEIRGAASTASLFDVLKTPPLIGRVYRADEETPGTPRVMVLSYAFWRSHFGGDSSIVGRSIMLNGNPRTVIGVMPERFDYPSNALFWIPLQVPAPTAADQNEMFMGVIGRLRDDATPTSARAELQTIMTRLDPERNRYSRGAQSIVQTLHDKMFGSVTKPLSLLLGAVMLLLIVACANVANLTLARSAARTREFAVRLAIGASRWRLARQLFVESALLAVIGGAVGAMMPMVLIGALIQLSPESVAGVKGIHVDATVVGFSALVTVVTALLFGLTPALTGYRNGAFAALKAGTGRVTSVRSQRALRSSLVVVEMAAALTLLTGAGLITKSFARALAIDPGFRTDNLVAANFSLSRARYDMDQTKLFYRAVADQLRAVPGVDLVATGDMVPLHGFAMTRMMESGAHDGSKMDVVISAVTSDFPRAIGMKIRQGRLFDANDRLGTQPVAILNLSAARQLFPDGKAIGQRLMSARDSADAKPIVVGVVDDVAQIRAETPALPQIFLSAEQVDGYPSWIVVRGTIDAGAAKAALTRIVLSIDPLQPVSTFVSMPDALSKQLAPRRLNSVLINAFAWLALVLSMIGLYGLISHAVATRTAELGIRIALGAGHGSVMQLIFKQGVVLSAIGIAVGAVLSFALARTTSGMLYGVETHDATVFALAPLVLAFVAMVACYFPARRATRVDPLTALRAE